jgi:hypothetical protein
VSPAAEGAGSVHSALLANEGTILVHLLDCLESKPRQLSFRAAAYAEDLGEIGGVTFGGF